MDVDEEWWRWEGRTWDFFGIKLGKFEAFREDVPEILGLIYGFKIWCNQEKWWLWIPLNGWRTFCSLVDGAWSNTSVLWPPHTHGDLSHNHDVLIVSGCLGLFLDFYTSWSRPPNRILNSFADGQNPDHVGNQQKEVYSKLRPISKLLPIYVIKFPHGSQGVICLKETVNNWSSHS